jgi:hypothetical protein
MVKACVTQMARFRGVGLFVEDAFYKKVNCDALPVESLPGKSDFAALLA